MFGWISSLSLLREGAVLETDVLGPWIRKDGSERTARWLLWAGPCGARKSYRVEFMRHINLLPEK